jgi:hypothetical protein
VRVLALSAILNAGSTSSMSSETADGVVGGWMLSAAKVLAGIEDAEPSKRDSSSLMKSSYMVLVVRDFRGTGRGRGLDFGTAVPAPRGSDGEGSGGSETWNPGGGVNRDALLISRG